MRLQRLWRNVGIAAAAAGVGALLALSVGACGADQETSMEAAASQDRQIAAQPQLPPLDLDAPREFQTATFAFG